MRQRPTLGSVEHHRSNQPISGINRINGINGGSEPLLLYHCLNAITRTSWILSQYTTTAIP